MTSAQQQAMARKAADQRAAQAMAADPTLDPNADARTVIRHIISLVDGAAVEAERKWGRGVLPTLCGDLLAAKFQAQADKLTAAVDSGMSADVVKHGQAMVRAWEAIEKAAVERGHKPAEAQAFMATMADGKTLVIAASEADAGKVMRKGAVVFTVQEIANLLSNDELGRLVVGTKTVFADAFVKPPADWQTGDELPF